MKNVLRLSAIAISAIFLITGCAEDKPKAQEAVYDAKHTEHQHKHWGYSGDVNPAHWGELNEKFNMCSEGKQQTPINIVATKDIDLPPLDLKYTQGSKSVVNNGHTVQVNIKNGNTLNIDGVPYELKQFHFHTPSENHINGKSFPLEAHFVHATKDGKLAVVAVLFKVGTMNPTLTKIIKTFPLEENKPAKLDLSKEYVDVVMPPKREYYKFMGSLTTPPCSEQVKWFVLKTPQTASKKQIEAMHKEINKNNNRPIQPNNGREIDE
ncbi:MAG TPA: carbonic anhydrase family protein [Campylobacterales bacterium]|nr:carbonic anhydrase family protein [Campylobacterales bacterium]